MTETKHRILELVDKHKEKLGDGDYLELCNLLKNTTNEFIKESVPTGYKLRSFDVIYHKISIVPHNDKTDNEELPDGFPKISCRLVTKSLTGYMPENDVSGIHGAGCFENMFKYVPNFDYYEEFDGIWLNYYYEDCSNEVYVNPTYTIIIIYRD
jgi:hypothetical protein